MVVHVVRHAHIPSHETDVPLLDEGWQAARQKGRQLAGLLTAGQVVQVLCGPSRRTRETAWGIYQGIQEAVVERRLSGVLISTPAVRQNLHNLTLLVDGRFQEAQGVFFDRVRQAYEANPSPENEARLAYHRLFWAAEDPVGFWLTHPSPYAEHPEHTATRLRHLIAELMAGDPLPATSPQRWVCVTHSAVMRAYLRGVLGYDPGEPDYCGEFTISRNGAAVAVTVETTSVAVPMPNSARPHESAQPGSEA